MKSRNKEVDASDLAPNTRRTGLRHAETFVRLRDGDGEPGWPGVAGTMTMHVDALSAIALPARGIAPALANSGAQDDAAKSVEGAATRKEATAANSPTIQSPDEGVSALSPNSQRHSQ